MSKEKIGWLNTQTVIGFTDKRGHAWHYRASEQGAESNHYPGAIPVEDVRRRLFAWKAVEGDVTSTATVIDANGVEQFTVTDPERKAMLRPPRSLGPDDPGGMLGLFKNGYAAHDYDEWLLDSVATLLDDELSIGSAGLLKMGAVAWVSVEVPDTIETPEGIKFRPNLLAGTSLDGSLATTFARVVTNVVCDNTMSAALGEGGEKIKVKHSRYSRLKLGEARDALAIVHTIADDFSKQVADLTSVKVSEGDWSRFLDSLSPLPEDEGRSRTMSQNKRETLTKLWNHDERVAPWRGTAWGVVQAVNTMTHHEGIVRGESREDRNALRAVTGGVDTLDAGTLEMLTAVLA